MYFLKPESEIFTTQVRLADDTNATAESVSSLVESLNDFSFSFYQQIGTSEESNVFFSTMPASAPRARPSPTPTTDLEQPAPVGAVSTSRSSAIASTCRPPGDPCHPLTRPIAGATGAWLQRSAPAVPPG